MADQLVEGEEVVIDEYNSGEEYIEGESDEDVPEIILPSSSDQTLPSRMNATNYFSNPIQLGARQSGVAVGSKTLRSKTSVLELDIDTLEEKPWRKPGVDITQYFNYGFNEDTWRAYCARQHQMKMENQNLGKIAVYESRDTQDRSHGHQIEQPESHAPYHKSYHVEEDSAVIELVGPNDDDPRKNPRDNRGPSGGFPPSGRPGTHFPCSIVADKPGPPPGYRDNRGPDPRSRPRDYMEDPRMRGPPPSDRNSSRPHYGSRDDPRDRDRDMRGDRDGRSSHPDRKRERDGRDRDSHRDRDPRDRRDDRDDPDRKRSRHA